jgi:ribonucleoside-diphosphate reductase beta chain
MILESVLAKTGYHSVLRNLQDDRVLPGLVEGITYIKRDEARHIAFGVYFQQSLVRADAALWPVIQNRMNELLPLALGVVDEALSKYGDHIPYGLRIEDLVPFASGQYVARMTAS